VTDITAIASGNHKIVNASSMNYSLTSYLRPTMNLSSDNFNSAAASPRQVSKVMSRPRWDKGSFVCRGAEVKVRSPFARPG
jgi:hypothetical protein